MKAHATRREIIAAGLTCAVLAHIPARAFANEKYDVIVAGSGAGGLTAAIRAAESGARVLVLEANTWIGGASRVATGIFGCAGHPIQKALGFTNGPEDLYRLYISVAAATKTKADPEAARILADGAIPAADWLASLGVEWSTKKAQKFFLNIKEGNRLGQLMIPALEKKARSLGVAIHTSARASKILLSGNRVAGLEVQTPEGKVTYRTSALVLATGGFEANPEMIAKYVSPAWRDAGVYCTPANRGDGQRMAEEAGAALADMEVFKANPTVHVSNGNRWNLISAVRAGAIAVDRTGRRFINETGGYWQSHAIWAQPDHKCWLIFGDPVAQKVKRIPELLEAGSAMKAETLKELAAKIGAAPAALEETLAAWRASVKAGEDKAFGRKALADGFEGAFYAAEIQPMIQGTFGGVKTNTKTEALRPDGSVLPGLYAVGECASAGLRGVNPQTANVVFGSIAGREAASFAKQN